MCSIVDRVEIHVIYASRNIYGIGIYCNVLMSRGAEARVVQGFRGDPMPSTVSAIAWSWRARCVVRMGVRVIGV